MNIILNQGKGIRLTSNLVIARQYKNGQFKITVPKGMADAIGLEDKSIVKFSPTGKGLLIEIDKRTITEFEENLKKRKELKKNNEA